MLPDRSGLHLLLHTLGACVRKQFKAIDNALAFAEYLTELQDDDLNALAKDITNEVHGDYYLAQIIRKGVAYHIGYLPAAIRMRIENMFRQGKITTMFCTSTEKKKLRVCAYCRVSTEEDNQASSYELQVQNYTKMIHENPEWEFAGIFADEGISGTSVLHREHFLEMIEKCKAGEIDLIITKQVSRFARNVLDKHLVCIGHF